MLLRSLSFGIFIALSSSFSHAMTAKLPKLDLRNTEPVAIPEGMFSLNDVMDKNRSGLETEKSELVNTAVDQAKKYLDYKRGRLSKRDRNAYEKFCETQKDKLGDRLKEHFPFCYFGLNSAEYVIKNPMPPKPNRSVVRQNATKIEKIIQKNQISELGRFNEFDLREALRRFKSPSRLQNVMDLVLQSQDCSLRGLSFLLANKLEEDYPNPISKDRSISLYQKSASCGESEFYSRALYRLSLLYIWEQKWDQAYPWLQKLAFEANDREYLSRGLYWLIRTSQVLGKSDTLAKAKVALIKEAPLSVHTLLASGEFPQEFYDYYFRKDTPLIFRTQRQKDFNFDLLMAEVLIQMKEFELAKRILKSQVERLPFMEPELYIYVAVLFHRSEFYIEKFRVLAPVFRTKPELISRPTLALFFPRREFKADVFSALQVNEYLALALIRQESAFNRNAHSAADARGLMQILPGTARTVERRVQKSQLFNPEVNVRIGTKYFDRLIRRFSGETELALASYNAGPLRVDEWLKRYPVDDPVLFMDLIPFKETREYVASIARNYFWYAILYTEHERRKPEDFKLPESLRAKFKVLKNHTQVKTASTDQKLQFREPAQVDPD